MATCFKDPTSTVESQAERIQTLADSCRLLQTLADSCRLLQRPGATRAIEAVSRDALMWLRSQELAPLQVETRRYFAKLVQRLKVLGSVHCLLDQPTVSHISQFGELNIFFHSGDQAMAL